MSTHKHIDKICIVIIMFILLVTVCSIKGMESGAAAAADGETIFTENELDGAWDTQDAVKILLSDEGSTISGTGAYVHENDVHIVYAGKYVISGELSNGKILVEGESGDHIWLMFDGASIHCEDDAAVRVEQAGKVFFTLKDGTKNAVSSGASYSAQAVSAKVDGAVYSRDDLTINGGGSLDVTAEYQHGIVCNDDLAVTGGTIAVSAAQDGIHANDSVRIKNAAISITAGDDGIAVSNDDETAYLYIESGNIQIPSCYEGMEAVQITIAGGTVDIVSKDDGMNASGNGGTSVISISGGEITIKNENGRDADGLDSNRDILISGGKLFVSVGDNGGNNAIDYGSENGGICKISGGTVLACGSMGLAEGFDSDSPQGFLMYSKSAEADTAVTVKDADGRELLSETVPYRFSSVLVSTPEMKTGDTCTIAVGESEEEVTIDNSGQQNALQLPDRENMQSPDGGNMQPPDGGNMQKPEDENLRMPNGENMQPPDDRTMADRQGQKNIAQTADEGASLSMEKLLLLGISAVVLLAGCVIAFRFQPKG